MSKKSDQKNYKSKNYIRQKRNGGVQAHSQKSAIGGGGCFGGLGAEPSALENVVLFCKNNLKAVNHPANSSGLQ